MTEDVDSPTDVTARRDADGRTPAYVSPVIERLGTLAELTRGGLVGNDDGVGGAGDGSVL